MFRVIACFDSVVDRLRAGRDSFTEAEVLRPAFWAHGEDARLREDVRFRTTPWGRWMLTEHRLANELVRAHLLEQGGDVELEAWLVELSRARQAHFIVCAGDPRIVVDGGRARLATSQLSDRPKLEDAGPLQRFQTHLPLYSLKVLAALPAQEWNSSTHEHVQSEGWVALRVPGRRLNPRMFVARIQGHSMDNGRSGLRDGGYAVFSFGADNLDASPPPVVLVRGSFEDPETGVYAVKQFVREPPAPGDEGHTRVRLVSFNPDRPRYPDIVVEESSGHRLDVIANLVHALAPADYQRRATGFRWTGRRDLTSLHALQAIEERLQRRMDAFFATKTTPAPDGSEPTPPAAPESGWWSDLELVEADPGELHLTGSPLAGLLRRIPTIRVLAGAARIDVLASNLRTGSWRVRVPPVPAGYSFEAPGFEDETRADFERIRQEGPPFDVATVFALEPGGSARRLREARVSPGRRYRLLLPPTVAAALAQSAPEVELHGPAGDWRVWEIEIPRIVPAALEARLEALHVQVESEGYCVDFVGDAPHRYGRSPAGERYAVFGAGCAPLLFISGPPALGDGDVRVILRGERAGTSHELAAGGPWFLTLSDLAPGRYAVEVLPSHAQFATDTLFFSVENAAVALPPARVTVRFGEPPPDGETDTTVDRDLTNIGDDELLVRTPPLWPVSLRWSGSVQHTSRLRAGGEGTVELSGWIAATAPLRRQDAVADLRLDFSDLGTRTIRHGRVRDPDADGAELVRLLQERRSIVEQASGQFDLLCDVWFRPLAELLGYRFRPGARQPELLGGPLSAIALLEAVRRTGDRIVTATDAVLAYFPIGTDFHRTDATSAMESARRSAEAAHVGAAFLTDGLRWHPVTLNRRLRSPEFDLRGVNDPGDDRIAQFFWAFAMREEGPR